MHEFGVTLGEWTSVVRRARIGQERKLAALILASYADPDGTNVRCGAARLALDLERSYATARRHLKWLRETGLIAIVRAGNARRGWVDEYRLILAQDLLDRLELPTPSEYSDSIAAMYALNRVRHPVDNPNQLELRVPLSALTQMSADRALRQPLSALTLDER